MILHMDMDAFFASVEVLDNPELKGKPLVVGSNSGRGVVAAASYEARRYGIHSAMPMFKAKQRCPYLTIVSAHRNRYSEVSRTVMTILKRYSPVVEQVSIDEAYLDVSGCTRLHGPPDVMACAIKSQIHKTTSLTCSIGVAPLKFLAKIASDMHKPDGLTNIAPHEVAGFIDQLPVYKVPGVGKHAQRHLKQLGIATLGDVNRMRPSILKNRLGKFGHRLVDLAHGRDESAVCAHSPTKSISTERTLSTDTRDRAALTQHLLAQSQEVGHQLRRQGLLTRTITLKLKDREFRRTSRSATLDRPSQSSDIIFQTARTLLERETIDKPLRLIGVGASALIADTTPQQISLFPENKQRRDGWEKVDEAVDRITQRFGRSAVRRGTLAPPDDLSLD